MTKSHRVSVKALRIVVNITTVLVTLPLCPIFLAITKQLTVVGEPAIMRMATSLSSPKPKYTASGRRIAHQRTSLQKVAVSAGFSVESAAPAWKLAPIAIRPSGVARFAM